MRSAISSSVTATAMPCDSRSARRTMKSPSAFGARIGEGLHYRRAAGGLDRDETGKLRAQPADRSQLVERLPHADEADSAARGIDDDVGQAPAELFGELETHRLLPFDAVRLAKRGCVVPAVPCAGRTHDRARVGDRSRHEIDLGAV